MLRVNLFFRWFVSSLLIFASGVRPAFAQIDLHAHLHMKPGMGFLLQGSFNEEPKATHWSDKISTKVSGQSLSILTQPNRPKLIVISFYAHPYLSYSFERDGFHFDRRNNVRKTIEQEYQEFDKFIRYHPDHFAVAKNAADARSIIASGKTAIILSLEGAWATLESPEDYQLWIEERGLAIVTPVHLTPDSLGGNALMTALVSFANATTSFLKSVWNTGGDCLKTYCKSEEGFTEEGLKTIDELMKRKVWVDLAHSNEIEVQTLIQKNEAGINGSGPLPLLVTHTQLRDFYPVERGLGSLEINYIRKYDGIVGLIPSQFLMPVAMKEANTEALKNHPEESKATSAASGLSCISGLDVFKKTVTYAIASLGAPERVTISSDVNAPLDGLSPACGEPIAKNGGTLDSEQFELHRKGFYTYSQWNALTRFVSPDVLNNPKVSWADQSLEHFLVLWEKVRPSH